MRFLADENFPRPALIRLRSAGLDVASVAEECPGTSDEGVIALCARRKLVLLTFDKDFGELVFRRGLTADAGVILFRLTPVSPEDAAEIALNVIAARGDMTGFFCVVDRRRVRMRPLFQPGR